MTDKLHVISIIFLSFMTLQMLQNVYILIAIRRVRGRLERVHYNLMVIFLIMGVFLSITFNITSVIMLMLQDELMNNKWFCKLIVISNKAFISYGPTTALGAYFWITLQFVFPLRARAWSNSSTIRRSFFLMWTYVTVMYGLPAAVDPYVAQCQQSLMFPNWYHGLALVYTLLLPYMLFFLTAHILVFRTARRFTLHHTSGQTSIIQQRQIKNLNNLKRTFTLIFVMTIVKMILSMASTNYILFFNQSTNTDFYFHVFITFVVNVHLIILPGCMCRNNKVWGFLKLSVRTDYHRLRNLIMQNAEHVNTDYNNTNSMDSSTRSARISINSF